LRPASTGRLLTKRCRSHDGGVDCVAYDPRPIFGGKVVIQAKRYKNTVGVSAVRDLFGTMQNEGAAKGILVTTSGGHQLLCGAVGPLPGRLPQLPLRDFQSVGFTPDTATRTSTSPLPGAGSGRSTSFNTWGAPVSVYTMALMLMCLPRRCA
jgi:restriction endonuclease Mrr